MWSDCCAAAWGNLHEGVIVLTEDVDSVAGEHGELGVGGAGVLWVAAGIPLPRVCCPALQNGRA